MKKAINKIKELLIGNAHDCCCKNYGPLELTREQITNRIKENNKIASALEKISTSEKGDNLYKCKVCGQFWQKSLAWNWGGKSYLFKVPAISIEDWQTEPYMSPADMLIYTAGMSDYFAKNKFTESNDKCRVENCTNQSVTNDVVCLTHLIENLQKFGNLPKKPSGKIFEPYNFKKN